MRKKGEIEHNKVSMVGEINQRNYDWRSVEDLKYSVLDRGTP